MKDTISRKHRRQLNEAVIKKMTEDRAVEPITYEVISHHVPLHGNQPDFIEMTWNVEFTGLEADLKVVDNELVIDLT